MTHTCRLSAVRLVVLLSLAGLSLPGIAARAQDSRTVTEPTFPVVCTQVVADLSISAGEPSSELNTAHDTSMLQTALSGCTAGQAVELVAGGSNTALVIAPIFIPAGVTLLVDGGVTLFASRNPVDYQIGTASSGNTCGTSDGGSACNPLITVGQASVNGTGTTYYSATQSVTGIMGYGVINGRGGDKLITLNSQTNPTSFTTGSSSAWDLAISGAEDVPVLVSAYKIANVVLYKISLWNSPHFHVRVTGQGNSTATKYYTNMTVWGIKLQTPWTAKNTDGIDPTGAYNVSILNSVIGDGDDEIAISGSSQAQNFTFSNLLLTSGHGISVGSITTKGVSNVSVSNINFSGQAADSNQIALRIKSYCGVGGAVSAVTYNGVCVRNVATAIDLDPFYSTGSGTTSCPVFGTSTAPITYQNLYLTTGGKINFQGLNATTGLSYMALNNVYSNSSTLNLTVNQSADTTPTPANDSIALTGGYYPSAWGTLNTAANATGVTETNNGMAASSFPTAYCANAFPTLVGELFASTTAGGATANNVNKPVTVTLPATLTLNAMLQPANPLTGYSSAAAAAAPTAGVQFLDGTTVVGTGTLGSNGTLASVTLSNPVPGTHSYTANYIGDTNYVATPFGAATYTGTQNGVIPAPTALVITVNGGPGSQLAFNAAPPASLTYGVAPGTVTVAVQDVSGTTVGTSIAAVSLNVSTTAGYSATYTANAVNGVATFNLTASLPGVGNYSYSATSAGLTAATATESVTAATLTATSSAASRIYGSPNPALGYTITGYVNGDTASVVSGTPSIATAALRNSAAGNYPIVIGTGTLAAANYVFATSGSTLTINGGAPQSIIFHPLPSFPSGASYQLTATTTSGLATTYSVAGPASVSGSTLTITAAGSVTVTAANAGNSNYAAASSAQQTFTAK